MSMEREGKRRGSGFRGEKRGNIKNQTRDAGSKGETDVTICTWNKTGFSKKPLG